MNSLLSKAKIIAVLVFGTAHQIFAQCAAPNYVAGTTYATGQQVPNAGKLYRCDVGGWCSSSSAYYYAPGTGTAWTSAWTEISVCGTTQTPVLTTITITPSTGSVQPGSTLKFSAAGKDQTGAAFATTPTWTVSGGGSISSTGLFTATTTGTYTVSAKSGTVTGTASVTVTAVVNPVLTTITVTPPTGSVQSGSTLQFSAAGKDQNGAAFTTTPTWTVSGGGSISSTGLFTANTAGTYTISAKSGTVTGTASVTVTAVTSGPCAGPNYVAGTTYATGQQVPNAGKLYRCDIGGWCSSASAYHYAPGTGTAWQSAWTEISVCGTTQNPVLTTITVTPATASVLSGNTLQFSAAGKDQTGAAFATTPIWTVSGGGSISSTGLFTANTTGTYTVSAKSGTVTGTASVTVTTVVNPVLTTITVTPATVSVQSGSTLQFSAAGKDQNGAAFATTPTWTVSGGGSISSTGLFTANTTGTYTVSAKSGTVTGTASVTVTTVVNPVLTTITVTPSTASVQPGSTLQFSAAGKDQNGAAFATSPTWTVSGGGTISSGGLFTANTAGTYTVSAKSGTVTGTASVTVTPLTTGNDISNLITLAQFNDMFRNTTNPACDGGNIYTYANFIQAVKSIASKKSPVDYGLFAAEGSDAVRKREIVAFLANAAHETTGGWATAPNGGQYAWGLCFKEERGYQNGQIGYTSVDNPNYLPVAGKSYHGRGPIQISYPVNYGQFSEFLYGTKTTLLNNPELVASDGVIAFQSALWFWMTPQSPKPSAHDVMTGKWIPSSSDVAKNRSNGLGMTVNIINGGIECGKGSETSQVLDRIGFYQRFAGIMGVSYDIDGTNSTTRLGCANMTNYSGGARTEQLGEVTEASTFSVNAYPNPAIDLLNLDLNIVNEGEVEINLSNTFGQHLTHYKDFYAVGKYTKTIDITAEASGIYLLNVISQSGNETLKIEIVK